MSAILPASLTPDHPDYALERYSVPQAARYLGLSANELRREAWARRLGFRQRTRHARMTFSQADLDRWRQASRHEPRLADAVNVAVKTPRQGRPASLKLPTIRRFDPDRNRVRASR